MLDVLCCSDMVRSYRQLRYLIANKGMKPKQVWPIVGRPIGYYNIIDIYFCMVMLKKVIE